MVFNWSKYKILIVEDDPDMRQILHDVIKKKNAQIFEAENGAEALKILEVQAIDFILSDVQMPVLDGVELLKKVRARDPNIPIFLLATGQSRITASEAQALGAAGMINKPFKTAELLMQIQNLLERQTVRTS